MKTITRTRKPNIGDIFFGEVEFNIGRYNNDNRNIIEVGVTEEQCFKESSRIETIFSKGKVVQFPINLKIDLSCKDDTRENAIWVVEHTEHINALDLIHSTLPECFLIRARKMNNNNYDPNGELIEFFTMGYTFNNINKQLEIIGNINENKL